MEREESKDNFTLTRLRGTSASHWTDKPESTGTSVLFPKLPGQKICFLIMAILSTVLLASCAGRAPMSKARSSLTSEALENAAYKSEWPRSRVAKLNGGEYREKYTEDSASELVIRLTKKVAFGDLDGDGLEDAAVVLLTDPGASGTFYYLAAVINQGGRPDNVAARLLGDRVKIKKVSVEQGDIVIDMIAHGPDDPVCCPSKRVVRTYRLEEGHLIRLSSKE
jgi:hypothetical protein